MSRLRQQYPQNYASSGNISTEFENFVRYINAAELGNKTIGELLAQLFDDSGVFDGPVEMRRNQSGDLEYRVGEYTDTETGWVTLAAAADIRGEAGLIVGEIGAPIFHSRSDQVALAAQTVFPYAHDTTDDLMVFVDGVLQQEGGSNDYTNDAAADTVTFNSGLSLNQVVTIYKVRATAISGYERSDFLTTSDQSVFAFVHTSDVEILVYLNGILQREGGAYDYVSDPAADTVTFNSPVTAGNLVTILTVSNTSASTVTGLMMEANYTDLTTGLIQFAKVAIADGDIAQAKVSGLVTALAAKGNLTVSGTSPVSPVSGDLWVDTSSSPNKLKFWSGSEWLDTNPANVLPTFAATDANLGLFVNGTGTALEWKAVDLSSVIAKTQRGAANGVATLDANARLPASQLPEVFGTDSYYEAYASPANGTRTITRIFKQTVELTGIAIRTTAGTLDVQIALNGVGTGATYTASTVPNNVTLGTEIEVDGSVSPVEIGYIITNESASANLEVTLAANIVSS